MTTMEAKKLELLRVSQMNSWTQALEPYSPAFPGILMGADSEVEQMGLILVNIWDAVSQTLP